MTNCTLVSPARPSELLAYILKQHHTFPTTLIVCSPRAEFVASILDEVTRDERARPIPESVSRADFLRSKYSHLVTSPLHQLVTSRHIRTLYMPTVTHLRSYLSVAGVASSGHSTSSDGGAPATFISSSSRVPAAPPAPPDDDEAGPRPKPRSSRRCATVIMYGFLDLHRDTSEWSAQGLSHSCSTLVEYAHQLGLREVLLIEPARRSGDGSSADVMPAWNGGVQNVGCRGTDGGDGVSDAGEASESDGGNLRDSSPRPMAEANSGRDRRKRIVLEDILTEDVPLLTGGGSTLRKLGIDGDEPGWAGRTVEVGRVLKRWLRFRYADWGQSSRA